MKASQSSELEKEISFLREDLDEEYRLKDWTIYNAEDALGKLHRFHLGVVKVEEAVKNSLEVAHSAEK